MDTSRSRFRLLLIKTVVGVCLFFVGVFSFFTYVPDTYAGDGCCWTAIIDCGTCSDHSPGYAGYCDWLKCSPGEIDDCAPDGNMDHYCGKEYGVPWPAQVCSGCTGYLDEYDCEHNENPCSTGTTIRHFRMDENSDDPCS